MNTEEKQRDSYDYMLNIDYGGTGDLPSKQNKFLRN